MNNRVARGRWPAPRRRGPFGILAIAPMYLRVVYNILRARPGRGRGTVLGIPHYTYDSMLTGMDPGVDFTFLFS